MGKKIFSAILAAVLSVTICTASLAVNTSSILFLNNSEKIEFVFSGVTAENAVSETVKDGHTVTLYELTILPGSTMTEILHPYAAGRHSLIAQDDNGTSFSLDGGTLSESELDSLILTYLLQKEALQQQIAAALMAGVNTDALDAALKNVDETITNYMTLRENLKKAVAITISSPANTLNTTISRETTYEFIKQGTYTLWLKPTGASVYTMAIRLNITDEPPVQMPEPEPEPETEPEPESLPEPPLTAIPTPSAVYVNGVKTDFDAYNINGNNYFKLRDLAFVLNGTVKQFEITWDGETNTIDLISGLPYTPDGSEMSAKSSQNKTPVPTAAVILLDGSPIHFSAYNIDGNNYFKLRDIGITFDFNVTYNAEDSSITVNTSETYTEQ